MFGCGRNGPFGPLGPNCQFVHQTQESGEPETIRTDKQDDLSPMSQEVQSHGHLSDVQVMQDDGVQQEAQENREHEERRERNQRREEAERRRREAEAQRRRSEEMAEVEQDRLAWESEKEWLRRTENWEPWHQRLYRSLISGEPEPETPQRRYLFQSDLGDPISCVQLGPGGACMAGSVQGKVWMLGGPTDNTRRLAPGGGSEQPPPRAEVLAGFSDEGVRGLYLDEDNIYATFGEGSVGWRRARPHAQVGDRKCFRGLDRKNQQSSNVKHVLQRGAWACVLFPLSSTLVNVSRKEHHCRAFKLFDFGTTAEVAPCDFDGDNLIIIDRTRMGGAPAFHLVKLERNECQELDGLPDAQWISILKLWGTDCVACAVGSTLYLYDYRARRVRHTLRGHREEILAIDARDPDTVATLSSDGVVKLWNGTTGACKRTLRIPGANFFLAYPYCLCMQDQRILISCDEGVYLVELGPQSDVV